MSKTIFHTFQEVLAVVNKQYSSTCRNIKKVTGNNSLTLILTLIMSFMLMFSPMAVIGTFLKDPQGDVVQTQFVVIKIAALVIF